MRERTGATAVVGVSVSATGQLSHDGSRKLVVGDDVRWNGLKYRAIGRHRRDGVVVWALLRKHGRKWIGCVVEESEVTRWAARNANSAGRTRC